MRRRLLPSLVTLCLILTLQCAAQTQQQNNAYYLDDNGLSSSRNVIKVDLIAISHGELPVLYERVLTNRLSAEAGFGVVLPYYVHDFLPLALNMAPEFSNNKFGSSYWIKLKLYEDEGPDDHYIDFTYRKRNFSNATFTDISFGIGRQLIARKRLTIDYGIAVGARLQHSNDEESHFYDNKFALIMPLQLKIGYLF